VWRKLQNDDCLPALVFSFSHKMVEELAVAMVDVKLVSDSERARIRRSMGKGLSRLAPEDRKVGQVQSLEAILENGVGANHGGMLPILREIVEILLADGLLKVIFCVSTFAMGINVPARSCVFSSIEQFDGKQMADLTATEYVQMSDMAGRRGLDPFGRAIMACTNRVPEELYFPVSSRARDANWNQGFTCGSTWF